MYFILHEMNYNKIYNKIDEFHDHTNIIKIKIINEIK